MKESTIQQLCIDHLTQIAPQCKSNGKPIFFFAPLNETAMMIMRMFKVPEKTIAMIIKFLKKMGLVPGTPDLVLSYCGKTIYFELKTEKGIVSDDQKRIHKILRSTGHRVEVVRSFEEFKEILLLCGVV